ncbi:RagB/SusD family nutrient uptake outer membrane protein [Flavihumibacter fluvii]|uniref:RagB/SusD family nutrient uptake outer membrane protein n=1 Tax=Flavihumibacter fluvii TaxID=2838157 RepID=UPI001BDE9E39|nr:RagB/SusD family nutrient uptake outer membrane protein [Flavihumibacter fluvii]ULQ52168.1 RagB/SusD family nutrient uptake outer membrane protein [Flavihumibacter fluvii]
MSNQHKIFVIFAILIAGIGSGCEKFVTVEPPPNALVSAFVFADDKTAESAISGVYEKMMGSPTGFFNGGLELYTGLSGDELIARTARPNFIEFNKNALLATNTEVKRIWQAAYEVIYSCNAILEGLAASSSVSERMKLQLKGEALTLRAFSYSQLVQLFGHVPMVLTTDYRENAVAARTDKQVLLAQVEQDLLMAVEVLQPDYQFSNSERTRPNRYVAQALLGRLYLLESKWEKAIELATAIIGASDVFALSPELDGVFKHNSIEAIWQLMPVIPNMNTGLGYVFVQQSGVPTYGDIKADYLGKFEADDQRLNAWIYTYTENGVTYHIPYKYQVKGGEAIEEYYTLVRLAEIYLIRAEAYLQSGMLPAARADINIIRNRAGKGSLTVDDATILTGALETERSCELFVEDGHRWFDIKRWGKVDAVMAVAKPNDWHPNDAVYPLPQSELDNNVQLVQNPGY